MSFFSWNCRGLGNPLAVQALLGFVRQKRPDILFLSETLSSAFKMEGIRIKLNYANCFVVAPEGRSGGLALLWNGGLAVEVVSYSNHYIDTKVHGTGVHPSWRFTGYYGQPERGRRRESWELLRYLSSCNNLPWVIVGDFNDLLWEREKQGRVPHPPGLFRGFRDAVRESGLSDLAFEGCQLTWERGRGTGNWVREKLDRILVTDGWHELFPGARAWSLEGSSSDHLPLFFVIQTGRVC